MKNRIYTALLLILIANSGFAATDLGENGDGNNQAMPSEPVESSSNEEQAAIENYINTTMAEFYYNLGEAFVSQGHFSKAIESYENSAQLGYPLAITRLGVIYINGEGVPKDYGKGRDYFRQASDLGSWDGSRLMALTYVNGLGVIRDQKEALRWFIKAAEQGWKEKTQSDGEYHGWRMIAIYSDDVQSIMDNPINVYAITSFMSSREDLASVKSYGGLITNFDATRAANQRKKLNPAQIEAGNALAKRLLAGDYYALIGESNVAAGPSSGSCFVASPKGFLVTNNHVIEGSSRLEVLLSDGKTYSASVVAASANTDLAVLKIDANNLPFLPVGQSKTAELGDEVFTIGYPVTEVLGNEAKFTDGSISAFSGLNNEPLFMQISVPIQPGNSGGPLVTYEGEVIGVVTSTAAAEKFFKITGAMPQNVNWAVKAEYAALLLDDIPTVARAKDRREAIRRAKKAVCKVMASN